MIYIIWTIVNIVLGISILCFIFSITRLIYSKLGTGAAILFILVLTGLPAFKTREPVSREPVWTFTPDEDVRYFRQDYTAVLDKNAVFKIQLHLMSLNDKDRKKEMPSQAFAMLTGAMGYNNWTPDKIDIQTEENNFNYTVTGEMKWKLLNYTIYKEQKIYTGRIKKG